jgi:hypothetical protein
MARCALVVDDEWLLVEYARMILEELGCEVVTATCASDALHALSVNEAHRPARYRRSNAGHEWLATNSASEAATADFTRHRDFGTGRCTRWRPLCSQAIHPLGVNPNNGAHHRAVLIAQT